MPLQIILKSFPKHKGRPGQVGGSIPKSGAAGYNREEWLGKDVPTRNADWNTMSVAERDKVANAKSSVTSRIATVTKFAGDHPLLNGNDVKGAITQRLEALSEILPDDGKVMISKTINNYDDVLSESGLSPKDRYKLTMDAVDILAVQENEALGRQLGDHGIHHLAGNIDAGLAMLEEHPGEVTPEQKAEVYMAGIYHDAGYLTPPAHDFLDEGHPRWSMQHFDANVRPMVSQMMGNDFAGDLSHIIRTHDSTDINWSEDTVGSAFRVADNAALFAKEKLPPVFRYIPENVDVMEQVASKAITIDEARQRIVDNTSRAQGFPPKVQSELVRAAKDTSVFTGKMFAMLGGDVSGYKWNKDHIVIHVRKNPKATVWQKFIDLGQKQFAKLAEAYGVDPAKFTSDLSFSFKDNAGNTVLESVIE